MFRQLSIAEVHSDGLVNYTIDEPVDKLNAITGHYHLVRGDPFLMWCASSTRMYLLVIREKCETRVFIFSLAK